MNVLRHARQISLIAVLAITAGLLSLVSPATARADDRPLTTTPIVTWNMDGQGDGSKWASLRQFMNGGAQIALLQEAGSTPPGSAISQAAYVTADGDRITQGTWNPGTSSRPEGPYDVYYLQTDQNPTNAGRVNSLIVTNGTPDELRVVPGQGGRAALGVRFGDHWYFTWHASSRGGSPNDSSAMITQIRDSVRTWGGVDAGGNSQHSFTVGADFNRIPANLTNEAAFPNGAHLYHPGLPTRWPSRREYDYFVSSSVVQNPAVTRIPIPRTQSDHDATWMGAIRGSADIAKLPGFELAVAGDSISEGFRSLDGNGFRDDLHRGLLDMISAAWWPISFPKRSLDMVGSRRNGNMPDPEHEAVSGNRIEQVAERLATSLPRLRPNVVTLMAGTNNVARDNEPGEVAAPRLSALVDQILGDVPGVTVVVATAVRVKSDAGDQARIDDYNNRVRSLVQSKRSSGKKVVLADMDGFLEASDMYDDLHPNDAGYAKIGKAFVAGIATALLQDLITAPSGSAPASCTGGQDRWEVRQKFAAGVGRPERNVWFADMDGDGRDDYLSIGEGGSVDVWYNRGGDKDGKPGWQPGGRIAKGVGLDPYKQRLEFGDVAGDGRDDYLVVDKATGAVDAYINEGGDRPDGTPGWSVRKGFAKGTAEAAHGVVIFGNVAGSDKDDYVVVNFSPIRGAMFAWENTGGDRGDAAGWVPRGKIAQGVTRDFGNQFRLQNHDCDGKDDYWALQDNGAVDVWINKGGDKPDGTPGWAPRGRTASGVTSSKNVRFGDVDGDGRDDYLAVGSDGSVDAYLNRGGDPA
ncbi:GDSL-type esterase/lipase family protein [Streptomyces sp. NPDC008141]|uniref:GDSL-type esterase/lipase family protein n=1 Tax=Streptomyces sp. NPDC008141 TaxID=3364815 RepID=UPI0036E9E1BB